MKRLNSSCSEQDRENITNHKRVGKQLKRNTSRTEVTLPCRTRAWCTNRLPCVKHELQTPQITQDSSASVASNMLHSPHTFSFDIACPQNIEHQWKSRSYTFSQVWYEDKHFARVMASSRHLAQKAKPRIHSQSTSKIAKLAPKIGSCRTLN